MGMRWQTFQELKDEWEKKNNAELFRQERASWQRLQLAELLFDIRAQLLAMNNRTEHASNNRTEHASEWGLTERDYIAMKYPRKR